MVKLGLRAQLNHEVKIIHHFWWILISVKKEEAE